MKAKKFKCKLIAKHQLSANVMSFRFVSEKKIPYEPGQFLSVIVPGGPRRAFSFSGSPESDHYEICVRIYEEGVASQFLLELEIGSTFEVHAPFGDFVLRPQEETTQTDIGHSSKGICFISTGTGIGPIRAMANSLQFEELAPDFALLLNGARDSSEILYPCEFEELGIRTHYCLSQQSEKMASSKLKQLALSHIHSGRVTDVFYRLSSALPVTEFEYYICGNPEMVKDIRTLLTHTLGVPASKVHAEMFTGTNGGSTQKVQKLKKKTAA